LTSPIVVKPTRLQLLTSVLPTSRLHHERPEDCREKEARSRQGPKDACLGEALSLERHHSKGWLHVVEGRTGSSPSLWTYWAQSSRSDGGGLYHITVVGVAVYERDTCIWSQVAKARGAHWSRSLPVLGNRLNVLNAEGGALRASFDELCSKGDADHTLSCQS